MIKRDRYESSLKKFILLPNYCKVDLFVLIGIFIMPGMASDRYTDHGNDTVTDTETGLMWAAKDNGIPINWSDALSYCQNYSSGRHTDWRMPALAELESLYNPGTKNKQGYHVTKPIETSAQSNSLVPRKAAIVAAKHWQ